jgi:predicted O-linked N-acetylglucosamine transferase (SPINDLY family)
MMTTLQEKIDQALKYHQQGDLQKAFDGYQEVLLSLPEEPNILYLLGVVEHQRGHMDSALNYTQKALIYQPESASIYNSLGNIYSSRKQYGEALDAYQNAIALEPTSDEAYINLGHTLHQQGKYLEALEQFETALHLNPHCPETYNHIGNAQKALSRFEEAIENYQKALELLPEYAHAYFNLGSVYHEQKAFKEAESAYQKAMALEPEFLDPFINLGSLFLDEEKISEAIEISEKLIAHHPNTVEAYNTLANALSAAHQNEKAIETFHQVLQLKPDYAEAYYNLGFLYHKLKEYKKALQAYQEAIRHKPNFPLAYFHVGNILHLEGKLPEAKAHYLKAVEQNPSFAEAYFYLGHIDKGLKRYDQAVAHYQQAIIHKPDFADAYANLGLTLQGMNRMEEAVENLQKANELEKSDAIRLKLATLLPGIYHTQAEVDLWRQRLSDEMDKLLQDDDFRIENPILDFGRTNFYLAYQGYNDKALQIKFAKLFKNTPTYSLLTATTPSSQKPRIGFLSTNLSSNHTIGKLFRGTITHTNRELFDVFVFSIDDEYVPDSTDPACPRDTFIRLASSSPMETLCKTVADCNLDVLLYPDIGMDPTTYFMAHSRLARVQCVSWGHPVTTGLPHMDYFLSDKAFEIEEAQEHYTEKLVLLNNFPPYYHRPKLNENVKEKKDFGFSSEETLYLCPQSLFKLHPDFDTLIGGILRNDPNGRVAILHYFYKPYNQVLLERWKKTIPDVMERIQFVDRLNRQDFLNLMAVCDVMLDPVHFGGGNTSIEGFAFGTPVVTLPSAYLRGRLTYGFYQKMGIPDCIASSPEEYIKIAVKLGTDPDFRKSVAEKIRQKNDILFENLEGAREFEHFCLTAIQQSKSLIRESIQSR